MKIEDEIKQSKFRTEKLKLVVNLIFTGNWINYRTSEMLKPFNLTIQQYNILRILNGQYPNPATVNLLIDRMLDKMSNVSRIIDRLVNKKLVTRESCGSDKRCVDIKITAQGIKMLEKIGLNEIEWEKKFTKLSSKECKELNSLLDKLRD